MRQLTTAALLLNILFVGVSPAMAANEADVIFKGMLVNPPPCSIDNDKTIHVPFGDRLSIKRSVMAFIVRMPYNPYATALPVETGN